MTTGSLVLLFWCTAILAACGGYMAGYIAAVDEMRKITKQRHEIAGELHQ